MKTCRWFFILGITCSSLLFINPALAVYEDEETVPVVNAYETSSEEGDEGIGQRLKRLEQQVESLRQVDLLQRVNSLQEEVQTLQGKLEEYGHALKQLREYSNSKEAYEDAPPHSLDAKEKTTEKPFLENKKTTPKTSFESNGEKNFQEAEYVAPTPHKSNASEPVTDVLDEEVSKKPIVTENTQVTAEKNTPENEEMHYLAAYELLKARKLDLAYAQMKTFLQHYPKGQYASFAHYWIGEMALVKGQKQEAISHFKALVTRFPHTSKVSDAYLKLATLAADSGNIAQAQNQLRFVIKQYPDSSAAQKAQLKLKALES